MSRRKTGHPMLWVLIFALFLSVSGFFSPQVFACDLEQIRARGVLRHLGIPYANFVRETGRGPGVPDGLDVELMQLFAEHIGVRYELVKTSWSDVFTDLTGTRYERKNGKRTPAVGSSARIHGDIIANGLTILPCREKIVDYSIPTFPTGIWLAARSDSSLKPITPTGQISRDIANTKALLRQKSVLAMKGTCLDPALYDLKETGAEILFHTESGKLDEMAQAIIRGVAETTLLDIPSAMVALREWPGDIKIIGPISENQLMGVAVRKTSSDLLEEFNRFFEKIWKDGTYRSLVMKYYPAIFLYRGDFFKKK